MDNFKKEPLTTNTGYVEPPIWTSAMMHSGSLSSQFDSVTLNGTKVVNSVIKLNEYGKDGKLLNAYNVIVNSKLIEPYKIGIGEQCFKKIKTVEGEKPSIYKPPFLRVSFLTNKPVTVSRYIAANGTEPASYEETILSPNKFKSLIVAESIKTTNWVKNVKSQTVKPVENIETKKAHVLSETMNEDKVQKQVQIKKQTNKR